MNIFVIFKILPQSDIEVICKEVQNINTVIKAFMLNIA